MYPSILGPQGPLCLPSHCSRPRGLAGSVTASNYCFFVFEAHLPLMTHILQARGREAQVLGWGGGWQGGGAGCLCAWGMVSIVTPPQETAQTRSSGSRGVCALETTLWVTGSRIPSGAQNSQILECVYHFVRWSHLTWRARVWAAWAALL